MSSFIGIDLGTTFSVVAHLDGTGRPTILRNDEGSNLTPSCVSMDPDTGVIEVGEIARRTWGAAPEQAAARFKRDMGTSKVHEINHKKFTPTQLSAFVLKKLGKVASSSLGPVTEAVVTIPANFSNEARNATMVAAKDAGLNIQYIVNEPTAAAIYYAFKDGSEMDGVYAVYDLGGGTFDISVIQVSGQDVKVIASNGVARLGGDDFDQTLTDLVAERYQRESGEAFEPDLYTIMDAEEDKKSLSRRRRVQAKVGRTLIEVTRHEFEEAISALVAQAEMLCESTIEEAGFQRSDIRQVLLAGGSTRVPLVRRSVERVFGREPTSTVNVDEVVALGATLYAAYMSDPANLTPVQKHAIDQLRLEERTNKCFGTLSLDSGQQAGGRKLKNAILIPKGTKIPCAVAESFYTVHDDQQAVDCVLTESTAPETDPRFVTKVKEAELPLPPGRPKGQEIKVTFAYDANQIMRCSFEDVATGRKTEMEVSVVSSSSEGSAGIEPFLVE